MLALKVERVRQYLSNVYNGAVEVSRIDAMAGTVGSVQLKGSGYSVSYLIEFTVHGSSKRVVLETVKPGGVWA